MYSNSCRSILPGRRGSHLPPELTALQLVGMELSAPIAVACCDQPEIIPLSSPRTECLVKLYPCSLLFLHELTQKSDDLI